MSTRHTHRTSRRTIRRTPSWRAPSRVPAFLAGLAVPPMLLILPAVAWGQPSRGPTVPTVTTPVLDGSAASVGPVVESVGPLVPLTASLALRCAEAGSTDRITRQVAEGLATLTHGGSPERFRSSLDSLEASLPDDGVEAAYYRAVLTGARVETLQGKEQVKAAQALHHQVLQVLAEDPEHAGARHLLGRMGAAVMRLGGTRRLMARILAGGELLSTASWAGAREHLERGEQGAPCLVEHHLELARLMADTGDRAGLQREVVHILELTAGEEPPDTAGGRARRLRGEALALIGG